jgi:hypothetical protein
LYRCDRRQSQLKETTKGTMDDLTVVQATAFLAHLQDDGRGQPLLDHLLCVSRTAGRMSEKVGLGAAGATIGLLHDLGKYSRDFQQYLRRMALNEDYGAAGARAWEDRPLHGWGADNLAKS